MSNNQKFKIGQLYKIKLLSKDGETEKEGIYTYKGFDQCTENHCQHIFDDIDIRFGVKYNFILIPDVLLDRYDISEIFV